MAEAAVENLSMRYLVPQQRRQPRLQALPLVQSSARGQRIDLTVEKFLGDARRVDTAPRQLWYQRIRFEIFCDRSARTSATRHPSRDRD
jgi:hypothetical protein